MVLWANINGLNLMRAAIGSQCKLMNRGGACILLGSLKINLAAAFWINCRGLIELAGRPSQSKSKLICNCSLSLCSSPSESKLIRNCSLSPSSSLLKLVHV